MVIATHNIMYGRFLDRLRRDYASLAARMRVDVLCLQENVHAGHTDHAEQIAQTLGPNYDVVRDDHDASVATIYNKAVLTVKESNLIHLPRLTSLSLVERIYLKEGLNERKFALATTFQRRCGRKVHIVNFHLEAGGGNHHRRNQMATIRDYLHTNKWSAPLVACGDANAFTVWGRKQAAVLRSVLAPILPFCPLTPGSHPTHFFARQREENLIARLCVLFGKWGIDLPQRFDVVCTNMNVQQQGQLRTFGSDHDLVWAKVQI